jgi:hypothetical protein
VSISQSDNTSSKLNNFLKYIYHFSEIRISSTNRECFDWLRHDRAATKRLTSGTPLDRSFLGGNRPDNFIQCFFHLFFRPTLGKTILRLETIQKVIRQKSLLSCATIVALKVMPPASFLRSLYAPNHFFPYKSSFRAT